MKKIIYSAVLLMFVAGGAQAQNPYDTNSGTPGTAVSDPMTKSSDNTMGTMDERRLTDNQIAGILMTMNDSEVMAAKMALRRSRNADVKQFARKMVDDHRGNMRDTKQILKTYNSETAKSEMASAIRNEAKEGSHELNNSNRDSFDKLYVDQQVVMHEKALSTLTDTLIPNVTDANFKTHLEKTKTTVSEHLDMAKALQTKLQLLANP